MGIATSVIAYKNGCREAVIGILNGISEATLHSERELELLVTIDAEDERFQEICRQLTASKEVTGVVHHSMYFI